MVDVEVPTKLPWAKAERAEVDARRIETATRINRSTRPCLVEGGSVARPLNKMNPDSLMSHTGDRFG